MNERRLRRLLRTLAGPALVSPLAAIGCTPPIEPFWSDLPLDEFEPPACAGGRWNATAGLNPAAPADYVALRLVYGQRSADGGVSPSPEFTALAETGTACATATNEPACEQALAAVGSGLTLNQACYIGFPAAPCQHYLVTTAGDSVRRLLPGHEYLQFLGPIDTPAEALLLVTDDTHDGYQVECNTPDLSSVRAVGDGYEVVARKPSYTPGSCNVTMQRVLVHVSREGAIRVLRSNVASNAWGCLGRRTPAASSCPNLLSDNLGDYFANAAHLEAASVAAFLRLRDELRAHSAGNALVRAAKRAALDEVRHARTTARLARKFGGSPRLPRVRSLPVRSLEEIACENVAEGCVRETFGALVGMHQARAARDPEVAHAYRAIAADETRHAALAWRVARWAERKLSAEQRRSVREARAHAITELREELQTAVPVALRVTAGVPEPAVSLAWLERLEQALWTEQ
ncbi:MAG TPA: hypothetical protein VK524_24195 [Polyangiaceae bacterium]|nr:hypothetical protein [Polyangiaceae bacterium]